MSQVVGDSGSCERLFDSPLVVNSPPDTIVAEPRFTRPVCYCESTPLKCKEAVSPTVNRLLAPRGPLTVSWLIVAVVIDALKGVFGRGTLAHIGVKILKL